MKGLSLPAASTMRYRRVVPGQDGVASGTTALNVEEFLRIFNKTILYSLIYI